MEEGAVSKPLAAVACAAMALSYVAILYAPTLVLRLRPPPSVKDFMIRRFICAATSSLVSVVFCYLILPWQAVVFPLSLTCLMYAGSLVLKSLLLIDSISRYANSSGVTACGCIKYALKSLLEWGLSITSNILAWRNYVVAPLTEELVFRACMVPLLLCGGFKISSVIFLCPVFFSLAHLNHFMEVYSKQNYNFIKSFLAVGFQLGYTLIFGSYASFLFIRTGNLLAPLVAHICCNFMGLPVLFSRSKGIVSVAFLAGLFGFMWLLFPLTQPDLYNDRTNNCKCWHGYCSWSEPVKSSL
ncbi:CAAX prenyl protease 2 [Humulus lupulus]|uniref:CAAX prenyl protease 2 n=1 Tax=Humulus lupulus TaxID=3486 RepID=UPI002B41054D|nr:CAAX prenyl protease 2 [Humulus lupulus]